MEGPRNKTQIELSNSKSSGSLSQLAWRRFKKNKIAIVSSVTILLAVAICVLGYLITPDSTPNANEQILELTTKKPGFTATILKVRKNSESESQSFITTMLFGKKSDYLPVPIVDWQFENDEIVAETYTGSEPNNGEIINYKLADIAYPTNLSESYNFDGSTVMFTDIEGESQTVELAALQKQIESDNIESRTFLLGTDRFGRDMLSRLIAGTRVSLSVGFVAVLISLLIGMTLGAMAGFFRGWIDDVVMWFVTVVWSIPLLLLAIAITLAMGKGFWQVFVAVGLAMWVDVARIVRGQIISLREKEYIEACRALGFTDVRTIIKHILPNIMGPVIVISAANFAAAILIEAGLSFLGVGAQPPTPSWGSMIKDHYGYIIMDEAYLAVLPGAAIVLMVLAFTLVGNGIRDALDVKAT